MVNKRLLGHSDSLGNRRYTLLKFTDSEKSLRQSGPGSAITSLKTQNVLNNVSFSFLSVQSETQSDKIEWKEYRNKMREAFQELAGEKLPSRFVQPDILQ